MLNISIGSCVQLHIVFQLVSCYFSYVRLLQLEFCTMVTGAGQKLDTKAMF